MSQFVEECRREWKRLRVPDPVANEMAADLAADLKEAEEEGASAEEVLGSGAFDPRSFAASWAAERGVIQPPLPTAISLPRRSRMSAAIAASAVVAIIGAVLAILASPGGPGPLAVASAVGPGRPVFTSPLGPPRVRLVSPLAVPQLRERDLPTVPGFAVQVHNTGVDLRAIGLILLIVGIVGLVVSLLYSLPWAGPGYRLRRRTYVNEGSSGPG